MLGAAADVGSSQAAAAAGSSPGVGLSYRTIVITYRQLLYTTGLQRGERLLSY